MPDQIEDWTCRENGNGIVSKHPISLEFAGKKYLGVQKIRTRHFLDCDYLERKQFNDNMTMSRGRVLRNTLSNFEIYFANNSRLEVASSGKELIFPSSLIVTIGRSCFFKKR